MHRKTDVPKAIVSFEGPIGVGKTTLGRAVSSRMGIGFIDGDDHCAPGDWLNSVLQDSRRIAGACEARLDDYPAVILAYPLRCTNWVFYRETFRRRGIAFHCISLTASIAHITGRDRRPSTDEVDRATEMMAQGYGQRRFSDLIVRTDESSFEQTCDRLAKDVRTLMSRDA